MYDEKKSCSEHKDEKSNLNMEWKVNEGLKSPSRWYLQSKLLGNLFKTSCSQQVPYKCQDDKTDQYCIWIEACAKYFTSTGLERMIGDCSWQHSHNCSLSSIDGVLCLWLWCELQFQYKREILPGLKDQAGHDTINLYIKPGAFQNFGTPWNCAYLRVFMD